MDSSVPRKKVLFLGLGAPPKPAPSLLQRLSKQIFGGPEETDVGQDLELKRLKDIFSNEAVAPYFELIARYPYGVRADEVKELVIRHRPDIVHFSGHASTNGELYFEEGPAGPEHVNSAGLASLISGLGVAGVVLNGCGTKDALAAWIHAEDGPWFAVGHEGEIRTLDAIRFACHFYQGLVHFTHLERTMESLQTRLSPDDPSRVWYQHRNAALWAAPFFESPLVEFDDYANALVSTHGKLLQLAEALHEDGRPREIGLTDVYEPAEVQQCEGIDLVSLGLSTRVVKRLLATGQLDAELAGHHDASHKLLEYRSIHSINSLFAADAPRRVVILGGPGAGKSSALRQYALQWAKDITRASLPLPLFIELRHSHFTRWFR